MSTDKVYIILLNYKGWQHTIECLESLIKLNHANHQFVVIDNHSPDGSLERIIAWAEGKLNIWLSDDVPLKKNMFPLNNKAVPYIVYSREEAEQGGQPARENKAEHTVGSQEHDTIHPPLIIIKAGRNLGFSGGINIGLRYAMGKKDARYVWLLNNDTVVQKDALNHLIQEISKSDKIGAVGSVHLDYLHPESIKTMGGGMYLKYFGLTKYIGKNETYTPQLVDKLNDTINVDFISGCSILLSSTILTRVGLLDDNYFLYWEDADWSERIKRKGYLLRCAIKSVVYHKQGQSVSSQMNAYFSTLNCFRFYRTYHPFLLPGVMVSRFLFMLLMSVRERNPTIVKGAIKAYRHFLKAGPVGQVADPWSSS